MKRSNPVLLVMVYSYRDMEVNIVPVAVKKPRPIYRQTVYQFRVYGPTSYHSKHSWYCPDIALRAATAYIDRIKHLDEMIKKIQFDDYSNAEQYVVQEKSSIAPADVVIDKSV